MFTTGDQRAQPKAVGGKGAGLGPGKTRKETRLLKDISTTWGLQASDDPIKAITRFRAHGQAVKPQYVTLCAVHLVEVARFDKLLHGLRHSAHEHVRAEGIRGSSMERAEGFPPGKRPVLKAAETRTKRASCESD